MIINRSSSYRLTVLAAPATGPLLAVGAFHHYDHYDDHQHNHDNITRVIIIIIIFMITCHHINTLVLWHNWYCISGPLPPPHHHPPHLHRHFHYPRIRCTTDWWHNWHCRRGSAPPPLLLLWNFFPLWGLLLPW